MISVVVPVYKVEKYLRRCVDSILAQTYQDFELILVDDGSPDSCGRICDEYASTDSRIKTIHQENGGLSAARNTGLDAAQGEYVAFVDSDDYCRPEMLKVLHDKIVQTGADVVLCGYKRVDQQGNEVDGKSYSPKTDELIDREEALKRLCITERDYLSVVWNKIYKRELFISVRFPVGKFFEDDFVTLLIFNRCDLIAVIPQFLYYYAAREDSITEGPKTVRHFDIVESRFLRVKLLQSLGFSRENVEQCAENTINCYWWLFGDIKVKKISSKEKKRRREIKKMVRSCYKLIKAKLPERIKFESPKIYRLMRSLKKTTRAVISRCRSF